MQLSPDLGGVAISSDDLHDLARPFEYDSGARYPENLVPVCSAHNLFLTRQGQFITVDRAQENSAVAVTEWPCPVEEVLAGLITAVEASVTKRKVRLQKLRATLITLKRAAQ